VSYSLHYAYTDGSSALLLQRDKRTADADIPTRSDADDFLRFFDEKVKAVGASTEGQQLPTSTTPEELKN